VGALDGLRVIEAGLLVQGPQASALLAQMGADVVKVELPGFGDQARWLPVAIGDTRSAYFHACNRGKRSVAIDLRTDAGAEVFRRLADGADVIITNFKPGTMDDWGLGYDALAARNPRLVYATGSAFGPVGPDARREGADLSGQAAGGLISATGVDGGEPTPIGATIADHIASQNLVSGVLAALLARDRTGRGQRVDVSLLGGQVWAQASEYTFCLLTGAVPGRPNRSNAMIAGIYGIVPTADGWLALVGVVGPARDRFFEAIGRSDLLKDPRFNGLYLGHDEKAALFAIFAEVFSQRPTAHWCEILRAAGQRFAPVRDYAAVVDDPQVWANGYLTTATDNAGHDTTVVGSPISFSDTPTDPGGPAPELGQNTEEVLLELGYTWDEITDLRNAGAI
jgi:crotonobetainyl-CoA:carnitine CoA-transferase CaiB-like acyl-CoA transferase